MGANRELLERYVERYNAGDIEAVGDLYAEGAVRKMPDGTFEGRSSIRERLASELAVFTDVIYTVSSFVEEGDSFADEWTIAGTNTGPLTLPDGTEFPPTGKRVEISGMEFVQVRGGKIVIHNLYHDNMAVMVQLGLVPQGATA
jgi:predicted ester cyclase